MGHLTCILDRSSRALITLGILLTSASLISPAAIAQTPREPLRTYWSGYFENDTFYDKDQSYTNGVKLMRMSSLDGMLGARLLPDKLLRSIWSPDCGRDPDYCWNWMTGWSIGQLMYTPRIIDTPIIDQAERPFGGLLYLGRVFTSSRPSQATMKAQEHTLSLDAGFTGKWSFAEETQKFVHKNIAKGAATPRGWGNQIPTELSINLAYSHRRRVAEALTESGKRWFDIVPDVNGAFGTTFINAGTATMFRVGWNIGDDFGPVRTSPVAARMASKTKPKFETYLLASVGGRAVAHNSFLNGGFFTEAPHSVANRVFVGDAEGALVLRYRDLAGSFRWVRRSPEFKGLSIYQSYGVINFIVIR